MQRILSQRVGRRLLEQGFKNMLPDSSEALLGNSLMARPNKTTQWLGGKCPEHSLCLSASVSYNSDSCSVQANSNVTFYLR